MKESICCSYFIIHSAECIATIISSVVAEYFFQSSKYCWVLRLSSTMTGWVLCQASASTGFQIFVLTSTSTSNLYLWVRVQIHVLLIPSTNLSTWLNFLSPIKECVNQYSECKMNVFISGEKSVQYKYEYKWPVSLSVSTSTSYSKYKSDHLVFELFKSEWIVKMMCQNSFHIHNS